LCVGWGRSSERDRDDDEAAAGHNALFR